MAKELEREIKKILMGRSMRNEEGWLVALPEDARMVFNGVVSGAGAVHFRGLAVRSKVLQVPQDGEQAFQAALGAIETMGVPVDLEYQPDALCCLRRYFFGKPVLLMAVYGGYGQVTAWAYTGKRLLAGMACGRTLREFTKKINAQLNS